jgi:hypothetical protein
MLSAIPSVVRMIPFSVAAAVPAAFLRVSQAARLPLQLRSIDHSRLDHRVVILRSKNDVKVQAQVCR